MWSSNWIYRKERSYSFRKKIDKNGCISILNVKVNEANFVLINNYNPNSKTVEVKSLLDLAKMLETVKELSDKHIVLAGNFNFISILKKKTIIKFIELKEKFHLCIIWRRALKLKDILFDRRMFLV